MYKNITTGFTFSLSNGNNLNGAYGIIILDITGTNSAHTITIPSTWINKNNSEIENYYKRNRLYTQYSKDQIVYSIVNSDIPIPHSPEAQAVVNRMTN